MKRKEILLIGLCLLAHLTWAQKQSSRWYFGRRAGVDFNSGSPVALTDGQVNTREGCATLSDANTGDLLFYTDGIKVYNKNHGLMPNGLGLTGAKGLYSATQAAIIVPNPANGQRFFVVTAGGLGAAGLAYSEVDLTLDGGNGDVVAATKNTLLLKGNTEKLISVRHKNGTDYWIITHAAKNDLFYVYPVTATGIGTPTTYKAGSPLTASSDETGYLKVSPITYKPDTYRLVNAINGSSKRVEVFDFNQLTGKISLSLILSNISAGYGVEFSADGKLLYISEQLRKEFPFSGTSTVMQFNLEAGVPTAVNSSRVVLTNSTKLSYGALQMGPDGRIYVAKENGYDVGVDALGVITSPSTLGTGATYTENGFALGGKQTLIGLPTFVESLSVPFTYKNVCLGETTEFSVFKTVNVQSVAWDFGEAGSPGNTASTLVASHKYGGAGAFKITLKVTFTDATVETYIGNVTIAAAPTLSMGPDVTLCQGQTLELKPFGTATPPAGVQYAWQDGSVAPTYSVSAPGTYSVQVSAGSCQSQASVRVGYISASAVNLGKDTTLCDGRVLTLGVNAPGATFLWQDGSQQPTYRVTAAGMYWVDVRAGGCEYKDTIQVGYVPAPTFNLGRDTSLCNTGVVVLSAANPSFPTATYRWQDGSAAATFTVTSSGTYWAEATVGLCTIRDSIVVGYVTEPPRISLGPDTTLGQWSDGVVLRAYSPYATYRWQDGSTDSTLTVKEAGTYWVEVSNGCGAVTDTVEVAGPVCEGFQIPNIITPNGDGYNDAFYAVCDDGIWALEVFDRWGTRVFSETFYQNRWEADGLHDGLYFYSLVNTKTKNTRRGWLQITRQ